MNMSCKSCGRILDIYGRRYPPKQGGYLIPSLEVNNLIVKKENEKYKLLLIIQSENSNFYSLPGGIVNYGESLEFSVVRQLYETCGLIGKNPKLFNTYGKPDRYPTGHIISVVYEVEVEEYSNGDSTNAEYLDLKDISKNREKFLYDHFNIVTDYIKSKENLMSYLI